MSESFSIPLIGLGTWKIEDRETLDKALETAIDAGYRMIDTAFVYKNEQLIGESLQSLYKRGKIRREDIFITTKLPINGMQPGSVEYFLNLSLKALQTEYIDLYMIHFPVGTKRTEDDYDYFPMKDGDVLLDKEFNLIETWKAMETLVDKKLVKYIGLSNCNSKQIQKIYHEARIKPAALEVECHAYLAQNDLLELCQKLNVSFIAYSPLGTPGLQEIVRKLTNKCDFNLERLLDDCRVVKLSSKHGKTPAQILLRFLIQRGITVIPKSSNPERIKENIKLFDFNLDDEDMQILRSMDKGYRYFKFNDFKSYVDHEEYPFNIPF